MQDMKLTDQMTGHEIARHESARKISYENRLDLRCNAVCNIFKQRKITTQSSKLSCILLQNSTILECFTGNN